MTHHDYIIAEVLLRSDYDLGAIIKGFKPFEVEADDTTPTATINILPGTLSEPVGTRLLTSYLAEANPDGLFLKTDNGYAYEVVRRDNTSHKALFEIDRNNNHIICHIDINDNIDIAVLRFGLWVMYGVVIAPLRGIAIHSSAIEWNGHCALFLGESGTGKSTHTRLWREHIAGATLLNDDSPIIRIEEGKVWVSESTRTAEIMRAQSTECELYPFAHFVWEEEKGYARGVSEVKGLIENQREINKVATRRAIEHFLN